MLSLLLLLLRCVEFPPPHTLTGTDRYEMALRWEL